MIRVKFTTREHIVLNAFGLAVGALWWPLHLIGFWGMNAISLPPTLAFFAWKIHKTSRSGSSVAERLCNKQEVAANASQEGTPGEQRFGSSPAPSAVSRPEGECPRGTPGCKYADCSHAPGKSCYGGNAPEHVDMYQPGEGFI